MWVLVIHKSKHQNCQKGFIDVEITPLKTISFPSPPTACLVSNASSNTLPTVKSPAVKIIIYQAINLPSPNSKKGEKKNN